MVTLRTGSPAAAAVPYDAVTQTFTVSVSSGVVSPNKYGYLFQVPDASDNPRRLFVPFWVESSSFEWNDAFMYEVMIDRFFHGGQARSGPNGRPPSCRRLARG